MQNTQTISTNKIIFLLVFLCAAIFTSSIVFHLRDKPEQAIISPDLGIIFPAARDITSFKLVTADNQPFTQKNFYKHWTLLFFGFTHCASVCPTTLDMMSRAYAELHDKYPNLQVALISLDPDRDTPQSLATYTHSYNPAFMGVTGKIQELRKLQSQLGIFSARDDNSSTATNYQIQHTSSIMLINPQGQWQGLFKFGLKPQQFAQAFTESVNTLPAHNG